LNEVLQITPPDNNTLFAGGRYKTITAFEAALTTKLKERVTSQRTYQDIRKELAVDRILARLMRVSPEAWLLKGGVALEYRLQQARATTDIDISAHGSLDTITDSLNEAAALEMNEYFAIRIGDHAFRRVRIATYDRVGPSESLVARARAVASTSASGTTKAATPSSPATRPDMISLSIVGVTSRNGF
jgi:hypothetical protein